MSDSARDGWAELGNVMQEPFALPRKEHALNPWNSPSLLSACYIFFFLHDQAIKSPES